MLPPPLSPKLPPPLTTTTGHHQAAPPTTTNFRRPPRRPNVDHPADLSQPHAIWSPPPTERRPHYQPPPTTGDAHPLWHHPPVQRVDEDDGFYEILVQKLERAKRIGRVSPSTVTLAVPDPHGQRIGSGAATLHAIHALAAHYQHLRLHLAPEDSFFASFALGWVITNGAGLASYPIDIVRRRMMMTSGEAVKYKSSFDAFSQILKNEGPKSLFKGAGANILRAIARAGVLAGYDKLQVLVLGKKYGSGGAWGIIKMN